MMSLYEKDPPDLSRDMLETYKMIPVLIDHNQTHVMASASIKQYAPTKLPDGTTTHPRVEITIISEGPSALTLGEFVAANEIVALSFGGLPVRPVIKKEH